MREPAAYGPQGRHQRAFDYIECWYDTRRRHSTLGYLSPTQYESSIRRSVRSASDCRLLVEAQAAVSFLLVI